MKHLSKQPLVLSNLSKSFMGLGLAIALTMAPGMGMLGSAGALSDCTHNTPTVDFLSSDSQSGDPTQTLSYQVRVTNADTGDCGATIQTIDYEYNPPSGWTAGFDDSLTSTLPGDSVDYNIDLTSPANAQNGDVVFGFNVYQNSVATTDFDITYSVVNAPADTTAPTVSIISPANGSNVNKNSNVTITASAWDFVGVTNLAFYVDGQLLCTGSTAPTCVWHTPNKRGNHAIEVRAYDAAGNVGVATVSVTVR